MFTSKSLVWSTGFCIISTVNFLLIPLIVTVIVVIPSLTPVTLPLEFTVAIEVSADLNVLELVFA